MPPSSASRFSASAIWANHRRFYVEGGMGTWERKQVPSHAPGNAYMAAAWARVIGNFVREGAALPAGHPLHVDLEQPLHLLELGAGSARFHHLLRAQLRSWQERTGVALPPLRWVLTEIASDNLRAWREHRLLAPLFASGELDAGRFDAMTDERVELLGGGVLEAGSLANPLVVIASYVLDSLPIDVFELRDGVLHECLVDPAAVPDGETREWQVPFERIPAAAAPYGDADLDAILDHYRKRLGDTAFTMPVGPIACLRRLHALSGGRCLLIACDKGHTDESELRNHESPPIVRHHGAISMTVNFDALARHVVGRGGVAFMTRHREATLQAAAMVFGAAAMPATRLAFHEAFDQVGPIDVLHAIVNTVPAFTTMRQCIAALRLSCEDPWVFHALEPRLREQLPTATELEKLQLRRQLRRVAALHLPLADGDDVYFEIGVLFAGMGRSADARPVFEASLEHDGPHPLTFFNLGLCQYELGELAAADRSMEAALALEPDFPMAREWRLRIVAEVDAP